MKICGEGNGFTRSCCSGRMKWTAVAGEIASLIRRRPGPPRNACWGWRRVPRRPASMPKLVRLHREEGLSFANVVTFNLDEYYPMQPHELQSYRRFMHEHLFDHIDIPPENCTSPTAPSRSRRWANIAANIRAGDRRGGGIDLQLLGIGRTGHIGFNEPGSARQPHAPDHAGPGDPAGCRQRFLRRAVRAAARDHDGGRHDPRGRTSHHAGLRRRQGRGRRPGDRRAGHCGVAASFLQNHPNATVVLDDAAAAELTRCKSPWLAGSGGLGQAADPQGGDLAGAASGKTDPEADG